IAQWDGHHALVPSLVRATELATRLRDDRSLATILSALHTCHLRSGDLDEVTKTAHAAREGANRLGDAALLAEAAAWESAASLHGGKLLEARKKLDELASAFERQRLDGHAARSGILQNPEVDARWRRAAVAWFLGYPDDALARAKSALSLAQSFADTNSTAIAWLALAVVPLWCPQARSALPSLRDLRRLAAQTGILQPGEGLLSPAAALYYWAMTS